MSQARVAIAVAAALLFSCGLGGTQSPASDVCWSFDGGAKANTELTLLAYFNGSLSSCGTSGSCAVTVSGSTVAIDAGAYVCSTGTNPGGVMPNPAPCQVPPLAPGTYTLAPYGRTLTVVADGGGSASCP